MRFAHSSLIGTAHRTRELRRPDYGIRRAQSHGRGDWPADEVAGSLQPNGRTRNPGQRAGGTETCEVVTVVDTRLPGFGDIAEAFSNWEDVW